MTQYGAGACVSIASARSARSSKTKPILSKAQYDLMYERYFNKLHAQVDKFIQSVDKFLHQIPNVDSMNRLETMFAEVIILFAEIENSEQILSNLPKLAVGTYHFEPRAEMVGTWVEKATAENIVATNAFTARKNMLKSKSAREQSDIFKRHTALKSSVAASMKQHEEDLMRRFEALKSATKRGGNLRKKRVHAK